jgi:hypothetical protein
MGQSSRVTDFSRCSELGVQYGNSFVGEQLTEYHVIPVPAESGGAILL